MNNVIIECIGCIGLSCLIASAQSNAVLYVDEDTDMDGLPDAWEMKYFRNLDQNGFQDADNDGICNFEEWMNNSDPYGDLWAEKVGKGLASICWNRPLKLNIMSCEYAVYDAGTGAIICPAKTVSNITESAVTLKSLKDQCAYTVQMKFTCSDNSEAVKKLTWSQPEVTMVAWHLCPSIPLRKVDSTNSIVLMTRDFELDHIKNWDRILIGSKSVAGGGWKMRGIRFVLEGAGCTNPLTGYSHSSENYVDITEKVPCDPKSRIRIVLRYDGTGFAGINKPLYLYQSEPIIRFGPSLK